MQVFKASQLIKLKFDQTWLVEGLVPDFGLLVIYAHPKVGKSILTIQLAHALSTGKSFLDFKVPKKRRVLYIQVDEPVQEWAKQIELTGCSEEWDTLHEAPGLLNHPAHIQTLTHLCKNYDFIILDSLISLSGGAELKSPSVMSLYLNRVQQITSNKPTWLIHHKRKESAGIPDRRVSSAAFSFILTGTASVLYDLTSSSDGKTGNLQAVGRLVKKEINLARNGMLWEPDYSGVLI